MGTTPRRLGGRTGDCRKAARRVNRDLGKVEKDCRKAAPKVEQVGKTCESDERERTSQHAPNDTKEGAQGFTQGTCAGAAFSNPFTSELERDCKNTSLLSLREWPCFGCEAADGGGLMADGGNFLKS